MVFSLSLIHIYIQRGDVSVEEGKSLRDYITEYLYRAKNAQVHQFAATFDLDEKKLRNMMSLGLTLSDINEFGRFDELFKTCLLYTSEQKLSAVFCSLSRIFPWTANRIMMF